MKKPEKLKKSIKHKHRGRIRIQNPNIFPHILLKNNNKTQNTKKKKIHHYNLACGNNNTFLDIPCVIQIESFVVLPWRKQQSAALS